MPMKNAVTLLLSVISTVVFAATHQFNFNDAKAQTPHDGTSILRESFSVNRIYSENITCGDEISLQLFADVNYNITITRSDGNIYFGSTQGSTGIADSVLRLTPHGLRAHIAPIGSSKTYNVCSTTKGTFIREFMPNAAPRWSASPFIPQRQINTMATIDPRRVRAANYRGGDGFVDILIVYDETAAQYVNKIGDSLEDFANAQVDKMNLVIGNTGLNSLFKFRMRGVLTLQTTLGGDLNQALEFVSENYEVNGVRVTEAIYNKRNEVGADIVCTLIDTGSAYGQTGLGWEFGSGYFGAEEEFAESAFNVCAVRSVADAYTMVHEVGHNMGAGHHESLEGIYTSFPYSHGYYFTVGSKQYCTIMAYDTAAYGGRDSTQIPFFSSPEYTYSGKPVGDETHNNTQTIRNLCGYVMNFRAAKDLPEQEIPLPESIPSVFIRPSGSLTAQSAKTQTGTILDANEKPIGSIQIKIGKANKKKVSKISATVIDLNNKKYSAKAVAVTLNGSAGVVPLTIKNFGTLSLVITDNAFFGTINDNTAGVYANNSSGNATTEFTLTDSSQFVGTILDFYPSNQLVTRNDKKWAVVNKAGKVKYDRKTDTKTPTTDNPTALKLTATLKQQTLKGSFKLWTFNAERKQLRGNSIKLTGIIAGGNGYANAVLKKSVIGKFEVR